MQAPCVSLIGGDERSRILAAGLAGTFPVKVAALNGTGLPVLPWRKAAGRPVVILPVPLTRDGETLFAPDAGTPVSLAAFLEALRPGVRLLGGALPEGFARAARERGCRVTDLLAIESVARANAVLTAEGALALAVQESPRALCGARCVVVGSGRCGRALAVRLRALGAEVTLTARKRRDRLWARLHGLRPLATARLAAAAPGCDFLFNTVPAPVVGEDTLAALPEGALTIELASGAAGVDLAAAERLGKKAIYAPGLPGKTAPATAADILRHAVSAILREEYPWINCD